MSSEPALVPASTSTSDSSPPPPPPRTIPITIITGFLGSGKTTLILKLLPQLPAGYRVALLKNEFGDLAVDSALASASAVSGVRELLNGCICCNLVGQLGDALATLRRDVRPDRIVIETSGSAFPATLALEVNRLARESRDSGSDGDRRGGDGDGDGDGDGGGKGGAPHYVLDGVVSVIDVENWQGYEDTSYTARMQARYTDLIVLNKWELVSERRLDEVEDRVLDLEVDVPRIRSDRGRVPYDVLVGLDSGLAKAAAAAAATTTITTLAGDTNGDHDHEHGHGHDHGHQSEVNVLSVSLERSGRAGRAARGIDVPALEAFLKAAPKEDIYRIKSVLVAREPPADSAGERAALPSGEEGKGRAQKYILNWAFGRWTVTALQQQQQQQVDETLRLDLEMTIVTARDEANKWMKKIEAGRPFRIADDGDVLPTVKRLL